jgi:hypothetical protein
MLDEGNLEDKSVPRYLYGQYLTTPSRKHSKNSDGRYYRKSIEIIDTYKSIDTFDTRKKYR